MVNAKGQARYGLTGAEFRELKGKIAFLQDFKCYGCKRILIPNTGHSHLHHLDEKPRNNFLYNLVVCCPHCHHDFHDFQTSEERGLFTRRKPKSKKELLLERHRKITEFY